jgi:hypothetical protein
MNIQITNRDTNETYKTNSVRSLNTLKDSYGKYFQNVDINRIIDAKKTSLPSEQFSQAFDYDTKNGHIIEDKPQPAAVTRWQDEPATQKQYNYIRTLGYYDFEENMTKGQASKLISMIKSGEAGSLNMTNSQGAY